MHLYKKVVIIALVLALVTSMGAVAVSAQTSDSVTTRVVGATYKTPTTFRLYTSFQSVKPNVKVKIWGFLAAGDKGIGGQPVELWRKVGTGPWYKVGTTTTGKSPSNTGVIAWEVKSTTQVTIQYRVVFHGTSYYAGATSNVVAIKYENTKTKPYLTTLYACASNPVVPHGTTNTMNAELKHGWMPLAGKYLYVWKWSGGKWVSVSRVITRVVGFDSVFAVASYRSNSPGTGLFKFTFGGVSPYGPSTSNIVQLIWT